MEKGYVEVICGPMFAGKTEEVIRRTRRMDYAKQKYLIFKPSIDKRYSTYQIVSHSNYKNNAINIDINDSKSMLNYINDDIKYIIIDETQFFSYDLIDTIENICNKGINVICAGLDLDYKGKPFGIMKEILCISDKVQKLTAICSVCFKDATRTQRNIKDDSQVLIGATNIYEARCKDCHEVD